MQNEEWLKRYQELENKPKECLYKIVERIKQQKMSVMVGAGFSKNANSDFPNWAQLLVELYSEVTPDANNKNADEIAKLIELEGESAFAQRYLDTGKLREKLDYHIEKIIGSANSDPKNNFFPAKQLLKVGWNDVVTTNWDTVLDYANGNSLDYEVVKNSKQLKNRPQGRIVKLHGSLRSKEDIENHFYEFDNDFDYLYVIATDDFKNYNKKHETFSNFMKIKFLQESFCLVGFSGNDPNFKFWIKELKRVMTSGGETEIPNEIFFINEKDEPLEEETKQFFYNNFIFNVPLSELTNILNGEDNGDNVEKNTPNEKKDRNLPVEFGDFFAWLAENTKEYEELEKIDDFSECGKFLRQVSWRKKQGFNLKEMTAYLKYPLFLRTNLDYSNQLVSDVLYLAKRTEEIDSNAFRFIARWCLNNFYKLHNVFGQKDSEKLIEIYRKKILPDDKDNPFSELVFQYYRICEDNEKFELFKDELEGLGANLNCYHYQKLLMHFNNLDYVRFHGVLKKWKPEKDDKKDALYILRKIRLLNIFGQQEDDKKTESGELFKIAEENCDVKNEPQLYFLLCFYHQRLFFGFNEDIELKKKISSLQKTGFSFPSEYFSSLTEYSVETEFLKPNEKTRYSVHSKSAEPYEKRKKKAIVARTLNFFEFTGILPPYACDVRKYFSLLDNIVDEKENDIYALLVLFNAIAYFGNSSDEETLRAFSSKTLRFVSKEKLFEFFEKTLKIIETYLKSKKNPKIYFYFLDEVLKRLEGKELDCALKAYDNFVFSKAMPIKDNMIFRNLIDRGEVWGIKAPFLNYLNLVKNEDNIETLMNFIIENYVAERKDENKKNEWSPWFEYFMKLYENQNFKNKSAYFQSAKFEELLDEKFNIVKELGFFAFDDLDEKRKDKIKKYVEDNISFEIDAYYLQKIKSEKIKSGYINALKKIDDKNEDISFDKIYKCMKVVLYNYDISVDDASLLLGWLSNLFNNIKSKKNKIHPATYANEIRELFYLFGELDYRLERCENPETLKDLKIQDEKDLVERELREVDEDLFKLDWLYSEKDLSSFKLYFSRFVSYISYRRSLKENLYVMNMVLNKIILTNSKEFEAVIELFVKIFTDSEFNDGTLYNPETLRLTERLLDKFSDKEKIPYCYDDLFISEQMKKLKKHLEINREK